MLSSLFKPAPRATPTEYGAKIRSGDALLIDIRESDEWTGGVAETAALLPISELRAPSAAWRDFLAKAGQREVLLYCASGTRSAMAVRHLLSQGVRALNAGGLADWAAAGWPIVKPK
ncbi:rhodanese-like domain-containing protein [Opitutus terrae]|nr:rhodanese-like domain-containing protein [Opitutus terrae]